MSQLYTLEQAAAYLQIPAGILQGALGTGRLTPDAPETLQAGDGAPRFRQDTLDVFARRLSPGWVPLGDSVAENARLRMEEARAQIPPGYLCLADAKFRYSLRSDALTRLATQGEIRRIKVGPIWAYDVRDLESLSTRRQDRNARRSRYLGKTNPPVYVVSTGGLSYEFPTLREAQKLASDLSREQKRPVPIIERVRWNNRVLDTPLSPPPGVKI